MARRFYLLAMALLGWAAIIANFHIFMAGAVRVHLPAIYGFLAALSFFTMLTNILIAAIATACLFREDSSNFLTRPGTMSAAVVYIFVVGLVYSLLLRPSHWHSHLQRAVEQSLHDFIPILYIIYWLIFVPKGTLTWNQPFRWPLYPLSYLVFALLVGAVTDRYIYPFIDIPTLGYARVLLNSTILFTVFLTFGLIVVWIDQSIGRLRGTGRLSP